MQDVKQEVFAIIQKRIDKTDIEMTDKLEDIGLQSLDAIEMIFDLEEKFDIQIPYNANSDASALQTVGDVVRAVEGLVGSPS